MSRSERLQAYAEGIVQTIRYPLLLLDENLRVRFANDSFRDQFVLAPEETEERLLYELGDGQWDSAELRELLEKMLPEQRELRDHEIEYDLPGAGRRCMLLNARIVEVMGQPRMIALAIEDVTERRRMEDALTGQKELAEKTIDAVREPLVTMDWDLRIRSANESFYEKFKTSREETEGRLIYELGNGQWDIPKLRELLEQVLPDNETFNDYEVEHDFPKVGHRIMLLNGRRIDHIKLILLAIEDVTQRRAAERRRRFVIELNDVLRDLEDPHEIARRMTASVAEHLNAHQVGYLAVDEQSQRARAIHHFRHQRGRERRHYGLDEFGPKILEELRAGRTVVADDVAKDSRLRDHPKAFSAIDTQAVVCVPVVKERTLCAVFAVTQEVQRAWTDEDVELIEQIAQRTHASMERADAQRQLRESEQQLRSLNEALEKRVADRTRELRERERRLAALTEELSRAEQQERARLARVLHDDIQQLLVAARLRMESLDEEPLEADARANVEKVGELLKQTQQALRSLSVELVPPALHARGLAPGLEWLAKWMLDQHGLHVTVTAEPTADTGVEPMRDLLFQAVRELLLNVVKHAATDRAQVRLAFRGEIIQLEVRDEGRGFDPAAVEQNQEQSFGLFHLRERLRHMGGRLSIESAPGQGTSVIMTVPIVERLQEEAVSAGPQDQRSGAGAGRVRVLVVDDHQTVREGIVQLLEQQPELEVVGECGSGERAIELVRKLRPEVVVMDINLPGMNGIEVTRHIKNDFPNVRVIALSLHTGEDMAQAMLEAGAEQYLSKTGPSSDLAAAVKSGGR